MLIRMFKFLLLIYMMGFHLAAGIELSADNIVSHFKIKNRAVNVNLFNRGISKIAPRTFDEFLNMDYLTLYSNEITELPKDIFAKNRKLYYIRLFNNKIVEFHKDTLKGLYSLSSFSIGNNFLTSLDEDTFRDNTNLAYLWLYNNALQSLPRMIFSNLKQLIRLELSGNELTQFDFSSISQLKKLEYLQFSNNQLQEIPYKRFKEWFPSLREVGLDGNNFNCTHLQDIITEFESSKIRVIDNNKAKGVSKNSVHGIYCVPVVPNEPERDDEFTYQLKTNSYMNDMLQRLRSHINELTIQVRENMLDIESLRQKLDMENNNLRMSSAQLNNKSSVLEKQVQVLAEKVKDVNASQKKLDETTTSNIVELSQFFIEQQGELAAVTQVMNQLREGQTTQNAKFSIHNARIENMERLLVEMHGCCSPRSVAEFDSEE